MTVALPSVTAVCPTRELPTGACFAGWINKLWALKPTLEHVLGHKNSHPDWGMSLELLVPEVSASLRYLVPESFIIS